MPDQSPDESLDHDRAVELTKAANLDVLAAYIALDQKRLERAQQRDEEDAKTRSEEHRFRRNVVRMIGALIGLFAIALVIISLLSAQSNSRANHVVKQTDKTFAIVQRVTDPALVRQQTQDFLAQERAQQHQACLNNAQQAYDTAASLANALPSLLTKLQQDCK